MPSSDPLQFQIAAAASLPGADGVPAWIRLLPAGVFTLRDGRGTFDAGGAAELQAIVDASLDAAGQTELMIDYDHQSVFSAIPTVGGQAPAAGWIKELQVRQNGVWARVQWTSVAAGRIKGGEYRYISPLFNFDKATKAVTRLINAALVNMPAINFAAIAAAIDLPSNGQENDGGQQSAALVSIAITAGLQPSARASEITAAIGRLVDRRAAAQSFLRDVQRTARLPPDAPSADVLSAIDKLARDETERAVAAAMEKGKVLPMHRPWALAYCRSDPVGFASFIDVAPVLVT